MRKLTILLAVVLVTSSSTGCLCGRCRNWFHKGSPCGTVVAPPVMGAPFAVGPPMTMAPCAAPMATTMVAPNMCCEQAPTCCVPCDPCGDPCGQAPPVTSGYFGNYMEGSAGCGCAAGAESATPTMIQQP